MHHLTTSILAATGQTNTTMAILAAVVSCALVIMGASLGIATIGGRAVRSIARQPEAGGRIFLAMIIAAALIEGVTFFALLVCFLTVYWLK